MRTFYIYYLTFLKTGEVFYVGCTERFIERGLVHKKHYAKKGIQVGYYEIETFYSDSFYKARSIETYWIQQFRCWGFNLINQTQTGISPHYYKLTKSAA